MTSKNSPHINVGVNLNITAGVFVLTEHIQVVAEEMYTPLPAVAIYSSKMLHNIHVYLNNLDYKCLICQLGSLCTAGFMYS